MKNAQLTFAAAAFSLLFVVSAQSQTTLSGDHIIAGNLTVGTSGTAKNLIVTGDQNLEGSLYQGIAAAHLDMSVSGSSIPSSSINYWTGTSRVLQISYDPSQSRAQIVSPVSGTHGMYLFDAGTVEIGNQPNSFEANPLRVYLDNTIVITDTNNHTSILPNDRSLLGADGTTALSWTDGASVQLGGGVAIGSNAVAANSSVAMPHQSAVFGRNNVVSGTETVDSWVESDPLFVIGNGTGNSEDPPEIQYRNAVSVYKNGDVRIAKPQGDIPMGDFTDSE